MDGWVEYLILVVLVLINAFFAASEMAIVSSRKTRIKQLAGEGSRRARAVLRLSDNPRRFLATIQVGITLSGFFASAFGAVSLLVAVEGVFKGIAFLEPAAGTIAFIVVTVFVAFITLIFGELVPKTLAVESAEGIALRVARPIEFIARITSPVVAFLTGTTNLIVRLLGGKTRAQTPTVTREEVVSMVASGQEEGIFEQHQEDFIRSVFELSEKRVREVMVPRTDMIALDARMPVAEAAPTMLESDYSRYPIYTDNRENISGVVFAKDVLRAFVEGRTGLELSEIARPPYFVPGSKNVSDLFNEMQKSRTHIALIVDEYGGIDGMVTLEDLLEELVGDIQDEFDHEEQLLVRVSDTEFICSGRASLFDVNEELGLVLNEDNEDGTRLQADTLGGLIMGHLNHIPQVGESVVISTARKRPRADTDKENKTAAGSAEQPGEKVRLTVLAMDGMRIEKVNIKLETASEGRVISIRN